MAGVSVLAYTGGSLGSSSSDPDQKAALTPLLDKPDSATQYGQLKDGPYIPVRMAQPWEAFPVASIIIGWHVSIVRCNRWRSVAGITRQASCDCVARIQESGPTW